MNPNISFTFLTFLTCTHNSNTIPNQVPPLIRQKNVSKKYACIKKIIKYTPATTEKWSNYTRRPKCQI